MNLLAVALGRAMAGFAAAGAPLQPRRERRGAEALLAHHFDREARRDEPGRPAPTSSTPARYNRRRA